MPKKDKPKVIDEVWTEDHVRSFLRLQPPTGVNADFHRLLRAYQSMRLNDFEQFIGFFVEQGGDLASPGPDGRTLLDIVRRHRHGTPYADVLTAAGAA